MKRFLLSLSLLLITYCPAVEGLFGIQSGPEPTGNGASGSALSWATGMAFDSLQNKVYLTGSSSGTFWNGDQGDGAVFEQETFRCFVATLELPQSNTNALNFTQTASFGTSTSSESCFALSYTDTKLFVAGNSHSSGGGVLAPLKPPGGSIRPLLFGTVLDIDMYQEYVPPDDGTGEDEPPPNIGEDGRTANFTLRGGKLMRLGLVHYPVGIVADPQRDSIYVATLLSDDTTENASHDPNHPHVLTYPYGSNFRVYIEKLTFADPATLSGGSDLETTLVSSWFLAIGNANENSVHVGGLIYAGSRLYFAGTTKGSSDVFPDDDANDSAFPQHDEDGFFAEIDPSLGKLTPNKLRLSSQPGQNERILGVCQQEGEENEIFVVGSTTGTFGNNDDGAEGTTKAFWAKIVLDSFEILWTRHLDVREGQLTEGDPELIGVACAVTEDGEALYVAARALKGSVVNVPDGGHESFGGTDIVVVQARADSGAVNYVRQIGTGGDDIVTSIATDEERNALVYGSTGGSLMRLKTADEGSSSKMDIFMFSVSYDGDYIAPEEQQTGQGGPPDDSPPPPTTPPQTPPPTTPPPTAPPTVSPGNPDDGDDTGPDDSSLTTPPPVSAPTPVVDVNPIPPEASAQPENKKKKSGMLAFVVILLIVAIIAALYTYRRRSQNIKNFYPADSDHIVEYLKGFDDVEVDLKHSATGGWHGTYMNYPADGRRGSSDDIFIDRMSNTVVQDSLFMDDYGTPSLGESSGSGSSDPFIIVDDGDDERQGLTGDERRRGSHYDGLVDAYNSTWESRSVRGLDVAGNNGRVQGRKADSSSLLAGGTDEVWGNDII
jgi:hypothetical protein